MAKYTYRATLPDGREITRKTDRVYTHVAIVHSIPYSLREHPDRENMRTWGQIGWAGRYDLAEKNCRQYAWLGETRIIPVDNPRDTAATKPFDAVAFVMAYEAGELDDDAVYAGFVKLRDSGVLQQLQGSYQRAARAMGVL